MDSTLCHSCSAVDFAAFLTVSESHKTYPRDSSPGTFLGNLENIVPQTKCALCRLVTFNILKPYLKPFPKCIEERQHWKRVRCYLRSLYSKIHEIPLRFHVNLRIESTTEGVEHSQALSDGLRQWQPDRFTVLNNSAFPIEGPYLEGSQDSGKCSRFEIVREWMTKYAVKKMSPPVTAVLKRDDEDYVNSFRLIDLKSRTVKSAQPYDEEYAALSYVWGYTETEYLKIQAQLKAHVFYTARIGAENSLEIPLPDSLSLTIKDAICVCERLEIPNLWIDLFCIDQSESRQKTCQIEHMDTTYRNSILTLVAATGKSANDGLAGLQPYIPEQPQTFYGQLIEFVQGHSLVTLKPDFRREACKWSTRAWTYQEGLLSRSCLYFGTFGISFHTQSGRISSGLSKSRAKEERFSAATSLPIASPLLTMDRPSSDHLPPGLTSDMIWYNRLTSDYTARNLSQQKDIKNAINGLLSALTRKYPHLAFYWGLCAISMPEALLWVGGKSRRPGFPSWSWMGWRGPMASPIASSVNVAHKNPAAEVSKSIPPLPERWVKLRVSSFDGPAFVKVSETEAQVTIFDEKKASHIRIDSFAAKFDFKTRDNFTMSDKDLKELLLTTSATEANPKLHFDPERSYSSDYTYGVDITPRTNSPARSMIMLPHVCDGRTLNWVLNDESKTVIMVKRWEETVSSDTTDDNDDEFFDSEVTDSSDSDNFSTTSIDHAIFDKSSGIRAISTSTPSRDSSDTRGRTLPQAPEPRPQSPKIIDHKNPSDDEIHVETLAEDIAIQKRGRGRSPFFKLEDYGYVRPKVDVPFRYVYGLLVRPAEWMASPSDPGSQIRAAASAYERVGVVGIPPEEWDAAAPEWLEGMVLV